MKQLIYLVGLLAALVLASGAQASNPEKGATVSCSFTYYYDTNTASYYVNYSATASGYTGNLTEIEFEYSGFLDNVDYNPPRNSDTNSGTAIYPGPTTPSAISVYVNLEHRGIIWQSGWVACQNNGQAP